METDSLATAEKKQPKLRWYQYRLRSLFVLTTLVAIACSWLAVTMQNQRKQKAAAEAIEKAGGEVWCEPTTRWRRRARLPEPGITIYETTEDDESTR
jgi:hypothetical protein